MQLNKQLLGVLLIGVLISVAAGAAGETGAVQEASQFTVIPLQAIEVTASTGEKPQSKVWFHAEHWWSVLPDATGTKLWRLDDTQWTDALPLSDAINTYADAKRLGDLTHVLLFAGIQCELVSLEYDSDENMYRSWSKRPSPSSIVLDPGVEMATIDVDNSGRMWLASDAEVDINVRWSDPPYTDWSAPLTLASGVDEDDICVVAAFPNGDVGVLWSNQNTRQFGFRMHAQDAPPTAWSDDETPASASALPIGDGIADDHLNCAIASDGTLYAAVKTSYDTEGYTKIGLLVRRPSGQWDDLYHVDDKGTRPIALLNERNGIILVAYNLGNEIVYRGSSLDVIAFGPRKTLIKKEGARVNNVTSTKENFGDGIVILGSTGSTAEGVQVGIKGATQLFYGEN
ncbi:MAG: T9SS C-terminal target domain-containing protein [Candidatus Hydrogenedentota bacterium]